MPQNRFSPKSRNAVVVLGMHRSGTSALAGVMAHLGCDLPQALMEANPSNAKGYYESLRLYEMNDAILASGGGRWDEWQPFNPDWIGSHRGDEFLAKGGQVLDGEFAASRMFVIKDPRMCLLMPFWTQLFAQEEITPTYLHIHRNPVEVATSLNIRDGLPLAYGILLWLRHVLDAEQGSRGANRCFTSYDRLLGDWSGVIDEITARTGIVFARNSEAVAVEISDFLTPDMNNSAKAARSTSQSRLLSKWVGPVLDILESWAEQGEDAGDFETLDALRAELDATAPLFGALVRDARKAAEYKTALGSTTDKLDALRVQETDLQVSLNGYVQQAQEMVTQLEATRHALASVSADKQTLEQELATQQAARATAEQSSADLSAQLSTSTQELERLEKALTELDREKWQLQSELAQRTSETVDIGRRNEEYAEQVRALTEQIDELRQTRSAREQENEQLKKDARLLRTNLEKELEQKFETVLTQVRNQSDSALNTLKSAHDAQVAENEQLRKNARLLRVNLQKELEQKLETVLIQNRAQGEQMRETYAKAQTQQRERIAQLEADNWALRSSTSWKITKPLRSLVLLLRSRRG